MLSIKMRISRTRWLTTLLLLAVAHLVIADTLHIITLRHRPGTEIEPVIRPMLRPDEGLTASGYQLILRASESRRGEIERIVTALDVAQKQLTITVRQAMTNENKRRQDSVSGSVDVGSRGRVIVGDPRNARSGESWRYSGERSTSSGNGTQMQTLRVLDGNRAFIRIGQSVPTIERVIVLTGRGPVLAAHGIQAQDFVTGFDVLPRVRGEIVHLEITPRLSGPRNVDGTFRFQELQTTVTARLGEWIDLGNIVGQSSEVSRAILQGASTQSGESASISLKVE